MVRCPHCLAPLRLDAGPLVACAYCRAQTRLDAPLTLANPPEASGARLAETLAFVTPKHKIPWLEAGRALPIFRTDTLSTSRDDQDTLEVNLVEGSRALTSFSFPVVQRKPRGVVQVALTVRVSAEGAMSLTLVEKGTENVLDRAGMTVRVL